MSYEIIKNYVKNLMNHPGHPYNHVLRVYNNIKKINMEFDKEVLYPAALLHDMARAYEKKHNKKYRKKDNDKRICHAEIGAEWAREYLKNINYSSSKIKEIVHCIRVHRYSKGLSPVTIEARILQECDRIDAIGAVGIIRTMIHNHKKPPYHPTMPLPCNPNNLEEQKREINDWNYGIDHFFTKLLRIKDKITIPEIKEKALERHNYMIKFLTNLEAEVIKTNEDSAKKLVRIIRKNYDKKFYDTENPFKANNTLVGRIIRENDSFIKEFINQLKKEVL